MVLPDRAQVTMTTHFMRSYSLLAIKTCHRRGAPAIGGMAAQIPIKDDPAANEQALAKVRADKRREAGDGHDGTWVAHPGLVQVAKEEFDAVMKTPNQIDRLRDDVEVTAPICSSPQRHDHRRRTAAEYPRRRAIHGSVAARQRLRAAVQPDGGRRHGGNLANPSVAMVHNASQLSDGRTITAALFREIFAEEMSRIKKKSAPAFPRRPVRFSVAAFSTDHRTR